MNANVSVQPRKSLRFRGRSFMALVFAPEPPLDEWFDELDEWSKKSPGYFVGRPIILDVAALPLDKEGLAKLIADLSERDIRIMGVEGTKASFLGLGMPPLVSGEQPHDCGDRRCPEAPAARQGAATAAKAAEAGGGRARNACRDAGACAAAGARRLRSCTTSRSAPASR